MKPESLFQYIKIDVYSSTPKYLQLTNSIINAVESGKIGKNFLLPSINEISYHFEMARDTAERGYKHLKKIGVISSVPGKGYFIANIDFHQKIKVFLLFNKLSAHKKIIYDSLATALGEDAAIDLYIYNNDLKLFKKLILNKRDDYTHFVIIPHFYYDGEQASVIINELPKEKLILLDKKSPALVEITVQCTKTLKMTFMER
jgi:DNA-binding transcriptional regulator YhcF (GntR family)